MVTKGWQASLLRQFKSHATTLHQSTYFLAFIILIVTVHFYVDGCPFLTLALDLTPHLVSIRRILPSWFSTRHFLG